MLYVYIQDYDDSALNKLRELCRECFEIDWDTKVQPGAQIPGELLGQVKTDDLPALFIFEDAKHDELDKAVSEIRLRNALNYLVLRLWAAEDAIKIRPAYYRICGFLLQPINKQALQSLLATIYNDFSTTNAQYGGFFPLKLRGTVYRLPYSKIMYFEASGKKIIVRTATQEYDFYDSLEQICEIVPNFFMRVHRGFCVNLHQIESVNQADKTIIIKDGSNIPFSRTFKQQLMDTIAGGRKCQSPTC